MNTDASLISVRKDYYEHILSEISELQDALAAANHLIAEQNKLNKERQEWALHANAVIRGLNEQLATALAAIEAKDRGLDKLARLGNEPYLGNSVGNTIAAEFLSIKPDASALRQHDNALIERCAAICRDEYVDALGSGCAEDFAYNNALEHASDAIRNLKGK